MQDILPSNLRKIFSGSYAGSLIQENDEFEAEACIGLWSQLVLLSLKS